MAVKVIICAPVYRRPHRQWLKALEASVPALDAAEIDHQTLFEIGCPYISNARSTMLRKAMDAKADVIVFLDDDVSWEPDALVKLIQTEGEVVSGAYRFKCDEEKYMGRLECDERGRPIVREDGCVKAEWIPAGFLKITKEAVNHFMGAYPELVYGPRYNPSVDLFNHGAFEGLWWGEDYAFSRRWNASGGEIWVIPDLNIDHHLGEQSFKGNLHQYLLRQPGGSKSKTPEPVKEPVHDACV